MTVALLFRLPLVSRLVAFLGPRMLHGALWSLVGTVVSRGLSLASSVFVARWLGKESFGEFGVLQATVAMFGVFAGFGMGMTATKHVAELRQSDPERAGRLIGLSNWVAWIAGSLMMAVMYHLAVPIATSTLAAPHLAPYLRFCAPMLLVGSLNGAQMGALTGFEAFKCITRVNVLSALVTFPLISVGAWKFDLEGALSGLLLSQVSTWFITGIALRGEAAKAAVPITHRKVSTEAHVLWKFALPSVITGVIVMPVSWLCSAILVNQPGGYGEMGVFNVANQWRGFVMLLPNTLVGLSLPILSNLAGRADAAGYGRISAATSRINVLLTSLLAFAVGLASPLILEAYGGEYSSGTLCLWLLASSTVPGAYCWAKYQVLASHDRMWVNAAFLVIWAVSFILLTFFFAPIWRATGLALATLLSQAVYALITAIFTRKMPPLIKHDLERGVKPQSNRGGDGLVPAGAR